MVTGCTASVALAPNGARTGAGADAASPIAGSDAPSVADAAALTAAS
jgi:hypothetical protein